MVKKKVLETKDFSLYQQVLMIMVEVARLELAASLPVKNIVEHFDTSGCVLSLVVFPLLQLAVSATGGARFRSPKQARYQLRYTSIKLTGLLYQNRKRLSIV